MKIKYKILIITSIIAVLLSLLCINVFAEELADYYLFTETSDNRSNWIYFYNVNSFTYNNVTYFVDYNLPVTVGCSNVALDNGNIGTYWAYVTYYLNGEYQRISINNKLNNYVTINNINTYRFMYYYVDTRFKTLSGYGENLVNYNTSNNYENQYFYFDNSCELYLRCKKTNVNSYSEFFIYVNNLKSIDYDLNFYNNPNSSVIYNKISITGEYSGNRFTSINNIKYNNIIVYENNDWISGYDNTLYYYSDMDPVNTTQINSDLQNTLIRFNSQLIQNVNPDFMSEMKTGLEMFIYPIKSFTELAAGSFVISLILVFIVANTIVTVLCLVIRKKE